jgi:predicted nucleic acid-binding protein
VKSYVDSSVLVRILLGESGPLEGWGTWDVAYTSELTLVEACRVIDRLRLTGAYNDGDVAAARGSVDALLEGIDTVAMTRAIIESAMHPMPVVLRALDALHVATALALRNTLVPDLAFATHDRQQALAARAFGFTVLGA